MINRPSDKRKNPDEGTLPDIAGPVLDKAGFKDGYLDKWGTPAGDQGVSGNGITGYIFNRLPPGTNIADQEVSRASETIGRLGTIKKVVDLGFPGDGWDME